MTKEWGVGAWPEEERLEVEGGEEEDVAVALWWTEWRMAEVTVVLTLQKRCS